ncbi:MAG: hypothetical protein HOQ22_08515 [Nocardioidaceae bacterium]|nr:hypothetical protein [Nocardioidaceae bacterium]NUS51063.1 hypothetical protein [Nocardioidaceae bacterium]
MVLGAGCPRCASPVSEDAGTWRCLDHGPITPLWRPADAGYGTFAEHLTRAGAMPTLLPWPLPPSWAVTDFGAVAQEGRDARASFATVSGPTDLDGVVEVTVVTEEPGVGLGSRCAGLTRTDPGAEIGEGPPHAKVRLGGHQPVPLWSVLTSGADATFDRSVFAGEATGRWLWLVLRPASAALLLKDEWMLMNVADLGPELIDLPFGGSPPAW